MGDFPQKFARLETVYDSIVLCCKIKTLVKYKIRNYKNHQPTILAGKNILRRQCSFIVFTNKATLSFLFTGDSDMSDNGGQELFEAEEVEAEQQTPTPAHTSKENTRGRKQAKGKSRRRSKETGANVITSAS